MTNDAMPTMRPRRNLSVSMSQPMIAEANSIQNHMTGTPTANLMMNERTG